jgi:predicted RNA-binding protein with PIN domain
MNLLIDGYNVLFAAGLVPRGIGPGILQRARRALVNYLLRHLPEEQIRRTTIVFDAKEAPPAARSQESYRGLRVIFARDHVEADDLIEHLIRRESAPRQLLVVTSDLRLRVAARRRRAQAMKSEDWLDQIEDDATRHSLSSDAGHTQPADLRLPTNLTEQEVAAWLDEFELDGKIGPAPPQDNRNHGGASANERDWGPFPPHYGEDLLSDNEP